MEKLILLTVGHSLRKCSFVDVIMNQVLENRFLKFSNDMIIICETITS